MFDQLIEKARLARGAIKDVDWRRPEFADGRVIFGASAVIYLAGHYFNLPPKLFGFAQEHADLEVDDIVFITFVMSIGFAIYSYRRVQDLSREMKARRRAELDAVILARHDPLTGLPNRRFFVETLGDILSKTTERSQSAVLMMDLDGFNAINDAYGHEAGDSALIEFAQRVNATMRSGSLLTRVGGDEFAIIVPEVQSVDNLNALAQRVRSAMSEPFLKDQTPATMGVGIGIAIAPEDGMDAELLVRHADRALYRAKGDDRSCIRFFEPAMNVHVERRVAIERELRIALADQSIVPFFQPLIDFENETVIGFEALARWQSPVLGSVPPDVFITISEEIGLIGELSNQLLRQACREASSWPPEIGLAFNISAMQLRDPTLGLRIIAILNETGLSPARLELEITETALVDNMVVAQEIIKCLRSAGVRIALDDFGTGYASLSQLLALQLDRIKIDRSFVNRLDKDAESATIVRAILGLANGFGLATTAEGIETVDQLEFLKASGCHEGQGYLFGRAMPGDEIQHFLAKAKSHMKHVA